MPYCNICGQSIEIRLYNGRLTPIHTNGACTGVRYSSNHINSVYNTSTESFCKKTQCPQCQDPVFYIKHNGGTVWITPPLGPPWEKHECMYPEIMKKNKTYHTLQNSTPVTDTENADYEKSSTEISGVVVETETMHFSENTIICLDTGERDRTLLIARFKATHLLNKLITYSPNGRQIWTEDRPELVQSVLAPLQINHNIQYTYGRIKCPDCGAEGREARLGRHLRKNHNYRILKTHRI